MDWNLKAASWDVTGLEKNGPSNIDGFDGSSSFKVDDRIPGDFSIDLKLGGASSSIHESLNKWKQPGVPKHDSLPSGSMKRSRASVNNGTNLVLCLVDGCTSDLSNCREYHRRHKVCEIHSKTPEVSIRGLKRRFCQQCSRFHSLEEFDEEKRSCRKRLDGHNRRRRKPQPGPTRRPGSFLSNFQGSQLVQFSGSHVNPSTTVVNPPWSAFLSSQANASHYNLYQQTHLPEKQSPFLGSSRVSSSKEGKQFPFLQGDDLSMNDESSAEVSVCQPLQRTISLSETIGGGHNMFCDGIAAGVSVSDCALSLLSSTQMQTQSQPSGNHWLQKNSISLMQSMGPALRDHSLGANNSVLASDGRDANAPCPGMFQMQSGSSSCFSGSQMLPFNWE